MKKEQGAMGGDREGTKEEKEGGSSSTPREVPPNFSAAVAPIKNKSVPKITINNTTNLLL